MGGGARFGRMPTAPTPDPYGSPQQDTDTSCAELDASFGPEVRELVEARAAGLLLPPDRECLIFCWLVFFGGEG